MTLESTIALAILVLTYVGVAIGRIPGLRLDRAGIAFLGGAAMIALGPLSLEDAFRAIPADQLAASLDEAGIACARLRSPAEFAAHPQLAARDRWREVGTPGGPVRALLPPVGMPGREAAMGAVPALGQHTAAIRAELGFAPQ